MVRPNMVRPNMVRPKSRTDFAEFVISDVKFAKGVEMVNWDCTLNFRVVIFNSVVYHRIIALSILGALIL